MKHGFQGTLAAGVGALTLLAGTAQADQVFNDDVIVGQSLCVGQDCVNGENFGFDTIRLKENNLRIRAMDTSNSASFPTRDWQITFNDSSNGGQDKFSIDDIDAGRTPFTIEASAPSHSLYVDDGGRIGLGTSTPVVELQVVDGDSPTLRLEQDGSSGFTAQTWDVAGNETNFFVRDATNGSRIPFKIRPTAPTNAIYVDTDGDIGLGTATPDAGLHITRGSLLLEDGDGGAGSATLHVRKSDGTAKIFVQETQAGFSEQLSLENNGAPRIAFDNSSTVGNVWHIGLSSPADGFLIRNETSRMNALELDGSGNMTITGTLTTATQTVPDYVFEEDYELMPLQHLAAFIKDNGHLPRIPNASTIAANNGQYNLTKMQMALLEKVEELTLYTLAQEDQLSQLRGQLAELTQ